MKNAILNLDKLVPVTTYFNAGRFQRCVVSLGNRTFRRFPGSCAQVMWQEKIHTGEWQNVFELWWHRHLENTWSGLLFAPGYYEAQRRSVGCPGDVIAYRHAENTSHLNGSF